MKYFRPYEDVVELLSKTAEYIFIRPTNEQVKAWNERALRYIETSVGVDGEHTFRRRYKYQANIVHHHNTPLRNFLAEKERLKGMTILKDMVLVKGATVRFTCNVSKSKGIVNGTFGTVVNFMTPGQFSRANKGFSVGGPGELLPQNKRELQDDDEELPVVRLADGREVLVRRTRFTAPQKTFNNAAASFYMLPINVAFAMTFHLVKGSEFKCLVVIDATDLFQRGMMYTALSRPRLLDNEHLVLTHARGKEALADYLSSDLLAYEKAVKFQQDIEESYFNEKLVRLGITRDEVPTAPPLGGRVIARHPTDGEDDAEDGSDTEMEEDQDSSDSGRGSSKQDSGSDSDKKSESEGDE